MQRLSARIWRERSRFLGLIRQFFDAAGLLEVETPLWNVYPGFEAHLDSLQVSRQGVHKSISQPRQQPGPAGYLITSPEYNLKILLSDLRIPIYQIAHCFREGDHGPEHSEEFLMLEWYLLTEDLQVLMDFCERLFRFLYQEIHQKQLEIPVHRMSVESALNKFAGVGLDRPSLEKLCRQEGWSKSPEQLPGDDLFFLVFLNRVEPALNQGVYYLYDYPVELSSLSVVKDNRARRFEIYWNTKELANAYQELRYASDYKKAYQRESEKRQQAGQPLLELDKNLMQALQENEGLPGSCGIALGLDRLFAILHGYPDLSSSSPFTGYQGPAP